MIRNVMKTLESLSLALLAGVGLPFLVASASAQTPATNPAPVDAAASANPATPGTEAIAERIIVTGSYIPTAETESALPVTIYTADVLVKHGSNTPVEGLRQLPSFVGNASTEADSNAGDGTAFINLRAIGQANVLTLINGRRAFGFADVNAIPIAAVANVQVLKDGASSIYGSDAVAGVVNFNLYNAPGSAPYQGAEVQLLYGNTTDRDANVRQAWIRGGMVGMDGKFSVAAAAEYYERAAIYSADRTIATTADLSNDATGLQLSGKNNNSPTYGGAVSSATLGNLTLLDLTNNTPTGPESYRPFLGSVDPDRFNFRAFTPAIPGVEEAMYFVTARYKIFGDGLQLYGDIMYSKTKQDNGLAGAPFALGGGTGQTSPYNPLGTDLTLVRYRLQQELGDRKSFFDKDYYRYVVGLNGDFNFQDNGFIGHFGYDTGFVYERNDEEEIDSGDAQFTPLSAEIAAGNFNPFIGVNAPITGTVPTYNPDGTLTGLTQSYDNKAAAERSAYLGHSFFLLRAFLYDIKANAHLFPTLYNGGIDVALGYEHREVDNHNIPDPVQAAGDQLGFNAAPNNKFKTEVDSFFGELVFPFVTSTMNIPFVRQFELSLAYRYEKFKLNDQFGSGTASFDNANPDEDFGGSPRLTVRYQPTEDLTLRASWGQSFRAPFAIDLFNPPAQDFPQLFDPLKGTTLQPPLGVNEGGNPALLPETTDAYSAGLVFTPHWVPGFTITADVYQLFTKNLILQGADFAQLALTANGNSGGVAFSDIVHRDAFGNLLSIDSLTNNAGKRLVEGIDVTAVYALPTTNFGQFTLSLGYNHFFIWKAEPIVGLGTHDFLGTYNNGTLPLAPGAIPYNKGFVSGEWEWHNFDFVATGNYIGDFEDDPSFILNNVQIGGTDTNPEWQFHRRVTDYITLDLQLSYEFKKPEAPEQPAAAGYAKDGKGGGGKSTVAAPVMGADNGTIWQRMLWGTKLTVGCNNVFDRNPPTVLGAFNDNYDTSLYSIRNRYYYVSVNKKF